MKSIPLPACLIIVFKNTVIKPLVNFLIQYRWVFLVFSVILFALMVLGFARFVFDSSPRIYFEEGHKPYEDFLAMEDTYGRDFKVFIMLTAAEEDMFTQKHLTVLNELTEKAWTLPFVGRVDSMANFQFTYSQNDELFVEDLFSVEAIDNKPEIERRKTFALASNEILTRLISLDGKHAAVALSLTMMDVNWLPRFMTLRNR